jgi:hypothetical protein
LPRATEIRTRATAADRERIATKVALWKMVRAG